MTQTLPVSRLIAVSVNLAPLAAQGPALSTLLVLGSTDVIDVVQRLRVYNKLTDIATDFGTSAPEYLAAKDWFAQAPQPTALTIGRWAKTASKGELIGGTLSAANLLLAAWTAISNGGFHITIDAGSSTNITGLDFSAQTTLAGVAAVITAALTGATCIYDAPYTRFRIESSTTGAASAISFLTAPLAGTDISGMLAMTSGSSGAYQANGIAAESALVCVTLFDADFGEQWYALDIPEAVDADHQAVAAYIEASTNPHVYALTTSAAGVLSSGSTTDIAYLLKAAGYRRTFDQYSSTDTHAVASALARILTTNYNGQNTVITLMYKQEPGITPENLNGSQADVLNTKNCNVFTAYNNNTAIFQPGVMASGDFIDTVLGVDWLVGAIQTAVYNLLYLSPTKIPQTDAGNQLITNAIENVCAQAVANGLLAPGTWTSNGFGQITNGSFLPKGFYVYAPPIATQSAADRAARKSVPITVAVKLAGAVHTVNVTINVNR